ncbi:ral guanine nucleotide dissociation stimulator-like [Rattus norvegicus]|uniref:ral guanine nucleotide dissociation stimulator-like n=1 Tax=Rattus norvegicus TaxID=10116 RepID=UPI00001CCE73|nr:ral guanine nucleotide dissociation stimulator-like [Rattus norvegicus]XP_038953169.1 ral guanine nucleotide dissociation stimulator-like [Rattus norvegicus]XP_038953170.1 ral guanine nucleotide dissociation stimulator-like [Rattus norvegicus]XP_038953171.1 ral guanine nucleotide dissociation stimulator-like [Rattus norvegicus]XP_038953172.1 ral guanine nucleotide dissociation stimulator-like [Rattus norvegicus]|eukprot:XP_017456596.1 PREDICTED: ral guanine nucleotide dissociation stimulator-like [Rattus norvegicus]
MFSCCLRTTRGSGLRRHNGEGHDGVWRQRIHSCFQRLWPFSRKGTNLTKASQGQEHTDQVENASAQHDQMESQREACSRAKAVVEQMNTLVPSLKEWDPFSVLAFLSTYRYFATPLQVLDLVFVRYAYIKPYSKEDEQVKNTLCSFLETWMDTNPEDFCDPADLLPLKYLKAYLSVCMPHSDLSVRVKRLLTQLQEEHAKDSQTKDEEDSDLGRHTASDPHIEWV